ncbi:MAG: DUF1844 domain-containing protein [Planctomycetota bacterium]|jgi:hypothetical protein
MPDEDKAAEDSKIVDEDWKSEVRREKEKLEKKIDEKRKERGEQVGKRELPAPDFVHFVSGIAAQTLMQLGDIENPFVGERKVDLESARYSIDVIAMLEEKTKGNLTPDEERYLKAALHDLRMRYVEAVSAKPDASASDAGPAPGAGPDASASDAGPAPVAGPDASASDAGPAPGAGQSPGDESDASGGGEKA